MFSLRELTTSTGIIAVYYVENSPTIYVFEWRKMHFYFRLFYDNGSIQSFFPHAKNHNLPSFCHRINHNISD